MRLPGAPLNEMDYLNLGNSWITPQLADQALLRRVTSLEGGELVGRNGSGNWSGIAIPYIWPAENTVREYRLRRDHPDLELRGDGSKRETNKYLSPPGRSSLLYFVPGTPIDWLADAGLPIVILEGEKKTMAIFRLANHDVDSPRFLPVGLQGAWSWRGVIGKDTDANGARCDLKGPVPDLSRLVWQGRKVYIVFDSNVRTNDSVRAARSQLARELRRRGAHVCYVNVPIREGVNGVDDWLALNGHQEVLSAFENASTSELANVPSGFALESGGLYKLRGDEERSFRCGRLAVTARARNEHQENWSKVLQWRDKDNFEHVWVMPMEVLAGDKKELLKRLLRGGLNIETRVKQVGDDIADYINRCVPDDDIRCVQRLGWHGSAYVLPDESFGPDGTETLMFYEDTPWPSSHRLHVSGSLEDWRSRVSRLCVGNSRLVFAVSMAFAGPLLRPLSELGGGFHLRGASSLGKTTALFVAGSVWGGGSEKGFIRSWRATGNGIESVSPLHNDGFLCLDDLGQVAPQDAGKIAYLLANGTGTQRMTRVGSARRAEEFLLLFLSTGEISLAEHVRQGGQQIRGGQAIRMCDLPADGGAGYGLFERLNGSSTAAALAEELRGSATRFYGTPIRAFLSGLVGTEWQEKAQRFRRDFELRVRDLHGSSVSSEVSRAMSKFSLTASAGELASLMGITGWQAGEAIESALTCFSAWLETRGTVGAMDEHTAFRQVVEFFERHGASRFQNSRNKTEIVRDRVGFRGTFNKNENEFWILPEQFEREVCKNLDPKLAASVLKKKGFLRTENGKDNRYQVKGKITALESERIRVYAVSMRIMEAEDGM